MKPICAKYNFSMDLLSWENKRSKRSELQISQQMTGNRRVVLPIQRVEKFDQAVRMQARLGVDRNLDHWQREAAETTEGRQVSCRNTHTYTHTHTHTPTHRRCVPRSGVRGFLRGHYGVFTQKKLKVEGGAYPLFSLR